MGSKGGQVVRPRWFALHPELARKAGAKGGANSTRLGIKTGEGKSHQPKKYIYSYKEENER